MGWTVISYVVTRHMFLRTDCRDNSIACAGCRDGEGPRKGHVGAWRGGSDDVCMYCEVCWWMSADVIGLRLYCIVSIGASRWASSSRHRYEP